MYVLPGRWSRMMPAIMKSKLSLSVFVVFIGAITTLPLAAHTIPDCSQASLKTYETSGPCILGGSLGGILEFNSGLTNGNFSFVASGDGSVSNLDSTIQLTPEPAPPFGGFSFGGFSAANVGPGQVATYTIDYAYQFADPAISGADLGGDPPFGAFSITEYICANTTLTHNSDHTPLCQDADGGQTNPQRLSINDSNPEGGSLSAFLELTTPITSFAYVETVINLNGGTTG